MFVFSEIAKASKTWKLAKNTSDTKFVEQFLINYPDIRIGCTFTPEACQNDEHAWFCLKWCVETSGIKHIRFGIWWEKVEKTRGVIDLSYYEPFLQYLFKNNVQIGLAIGPIKTPRWPEEHVPNWVWEHTQKPKTYSKIQPQHTLGELALDYLSRLLPKLHTLCQNDLDKIEVIQVENEPFNPFGWLKVRSSKQYLQQAIKLVNLYFSTKPILLNSAGRFNLRAIIKQISQSTDTKFIVGLDYYYAHTFLIKFKLTHLVDLIGISVPWDTSIKLLHKLASRYGFGIEVTEAQMEPWDIAREPGNSVASLKYVLLRCGNNILNRKGIIRLWGVEYISLQFFRKTNSQEHQQILNILKQLP